MSTAAGAKKNGNVPESVRALARALEGSPTAAAIITSDAVVEFVNEAFANLSGYARERLEGSDLSSLRQVLDAESYSARVTLAAGMPWRGEVTHVRRDGREFWVSTSISPLPGGEGEITHFLVLSEDVTQYKTMEVAEMRRALRDEAAPSCVLLVALDGTVLFITGSMKGLTSASLVGQNLLELTLDKEKSRVRAYIDQVVRTHESAFFEVVGLAHDETTARYVTRVNPIIRDGEVVALTFVSLDLSNRGDSPERYAERSLQEGARYRLFQEASLEAIVLHGDGKIIDANPAFAEMFGYDLKDVIDMPIEVFLTPESHAEALERATPTIEGRYLVRGVKRDGSTFSAEAYVRNPAGANEHIHAAVIREVSQATMHREDGDQTLESVGDCDDLSPREVEVLELLARGMTNRQVAKRLRVSARTIDHHVSHILTKLNVPNRTAAVFVAEQAGVLSQ